MVAANGASYDFDWYDKDHDREYKYPVDCRLDGRSLPLFIYMLSGNEKVRDATIALQQFQKWQVKNQPVGIFRDAERINALVKERFKDVCQTMFPRFQENRDEIVDYLREAARE